MYVSKSAETVRASKQLPNLPSSSQFLPSPLVYSSLQFENGCNRHSSSPLSPIATTVILSHNYPSGIHDLKREIVLGKKTYCQS